MENDERLNDLVPLETRFRYILAENGILKAEIEHLEEELDKKNKAISEFKKWQKKGCRTKLRILDYKCNTTHWRRA